jgi:carbon starvation protein
MLTEGFLAVLVILACAAGLGLGVSLPDGSILLGQEAWASRYGEWSTRLGPLVAAFVDGSANFLMALGISSAIAIALMAVLVASFAATTLDTACRLQRYVVQELASTLNRQGAKSSGVNPLSFLRGKHGATILAVSVAALLAAVPPPGKDWGFENAGQGGLILWPLFGATNQLLAGLSFMVITFYLWRRSKPVWFLILPMIFMLVMPMWAMLWQLFVGGPDNPSWFSRRDWILVGIGLATISLEIWMIVEAVKIFPRAKGVIETGQPVERVLSGASATGR